MTIFQQQKEPPHEFLSLLSQTMLTLFATMQKMQHTDAPFLKEHRTVEDNFQKLFALTEVLKDKDINIIRLKELYSLSRFQFFCIGAAYFFSKDPSVGNAFSEKTVVQNLPTPKLFLQAYQDFIEHSYTKADAINDLHMKFLELFFQTTVLDWCTPLVLHPQYAAFLNGGKNAVLPNHSTFQKVQPLVSDSPLIDADLLHTLSAALEANKTEKKCLCLFFGAENSGRRFHLEQTAVLQGRSVLYTKLSALLKNRPLLLDVIRCLTLCNACLCITDTDTFFAGDSQEDLYLGGVIILKQVTATGLPIVLLCKPSFSPPAFLAENFKCIQRETKMPSFEESLLFWKYATKELSFAEKPDWKQFANTYTFPVGNIWKLSRELLFQQSLTNAPLSLEALHEKCNSFIDTTLLKKTTKINASYSLEDLVMEEKQKNLLLHAVNFIKLKHIVYDKWNFKQRFPYGRGLNLLFAGPPGTGKTMAAQVIASELRLPLYRLDLSKVLSKYIGETEEALREIFDAAEKSNVILFIDEMDALFGKRSETKHAHDRYANMETSFLLQRIEQYSGVVVMATNYVTNIDEAFVRRIHFIIHFTFPDETLRIQLWKSMFPKGAPLHQEIDFLFLGKNFEIAGGNIKNVALKAAFIAARKKESISMKHILWALKEELSKQGKILLKEDFGKYQFLLDAETAEHGKKDSFLF